MYHLIIYTPETHGEAIREALGQAGAGRIGHYEHCSFSTKGVGRFRPLANAKPYTGEVGTLETVQEERIEVVVPDGVSLTAILQAVTKVHPYEEPAIHVLHMEDYHAYLRP